MAKAKAIHKQAALARARALEHTGIKNKGNGNEFHLILFGKGNYFNLQEFGEIFKD